MKKCPNCNRTYADDGFTFCLEDGALLSAPYDPEKKEEPISTIESAGPSPTAVLPERRKGRPEVPPTVLSVPSQKSNEAAEAPLGGGPASLNPRRTGPVKYVIIGLLALIIVGGGLGFIGVYVGGKSNCPSLVIKCYPTNTGAYCEVVQDTTNALNHINERPISGALSSRSLILLQAAAVAGISKVTWSASAGTVRSNHIDTTGLEGQTITVTAHVSSNSWFCSTTLSSSFVAPSSSAPAH